MISFSIMTSRAWRYPKKNKRKTYYEIPNHRTWKKRGENTERIRIEIGELLGLGSNVVNV